MSNNFMNKFNKKVVEFTFKPSEDFEYYNLEDVYNNFKDKPIKVLGLYINKSKIYDESPLVVSDFGYINLPVHLVDSVKEIRDNEEVVKMINDGKVGFTIYTYESQKSTKLCYSINWVDL